MARSHKIQEQFEALGAVRRDPASAEARRALETAFDSRSNLLVAKAARLVGEARLAGWGPALEQAFQRFMTDPAKTDKGCEAKIEVVRALRAIEWPRADVFLRGVRHVQMEGSFGPPVDTAAVLRGECGMALVEIGYPEALRELVPLLVDPEPATRAGAARALGGSGAPEAALLLRLKVLTGDEKAEILGECFSALLALEPERSLEFVAGYVDSDDVEVAEAAALALGETRREAALKILRDKWERGGDRELRRTLLLAIATMRIEPAFEFLLGLIGRGNRDALAAMEIYKDEPTLWERVERSKAR